jgi:excinuclease ABC subunit C
MYEVLQRRFRRGKQAVDGEDWDLPDLFLVDGGRGQLAVAMAAAQDLGLFDLQLAGLAKERDLKDGEHLIDRVYLPGQKNPIPLKPNSPELFMLAHARDEAHRFANRSRERAGSQRRMASELDLVVGIGPKTRVTLLKRFGSLANVRTASDEALLATPGFNRRQLTALRAHWPSDRIEALASEPSAPVDLAAEDDNNVGS